MYQNFASKYDALMTNADYEKRTEYLCSLFSAYGKKPKLLLDLACGTGEFSVRFAKKGISVIGVDISEDMLNIASEKARENKTDILFLCQDAKDLDLYGTVDGAICCLDSLNHITDYADFCKAIAKVSLFLEKDCLFIFDLNTPYKHKNVLKDNTFVFEQKYIYCVWQNETKGNVTDIALDFFVKSGDTYIKESEYITERAYTKSEIGSALKKAGLEILSVLDDMTNSPATGKSERVIYVTRKI